MLTASQLRTGMAIRFENQLYRVVGADYQPGQGKMGGVMHARLQNLNTGTFWEQGFRADLKLEDIPMEKRAADFLYMDGDDCTFMDPVSFEQYTVPAKSLGKRAQLLTPEMRVQVEFISGSPVSVQMPDTVELKVLDTAPPMHNTQDSTWKAAKLDNNVEISVPQFVKIGDVVRIDCAELKYLDRAKVAMR